MFPRSSNGHREFTSPRITNFPASVLDIVPTLLAITAVKHPDAERPSDGISLLPLFDQELERREKPIPFRHIGRAALIDNDMKLLTNEIASGKFELYDLASDQAEANDLSRERPDVFARMKKQFLSGTNPLTQVFLAKTTQKVKSTHDEPKPRFWTEVEEYKPYFDQWRSRWEYRSRLTKNQK